MDFGSQLFAHPSLVSHQRRVVADIMLDALRAVDPVAAVRQTIHVANGQLCIADTCLPLDSFDRVLIVGAGKATASMAAGIEQQIGDLITDGHIIVKDGHALPLSTVRISEAGHPLPDLRGVTATRQLLDLLSQTSERDLVIALISGGGSALLTCPASGISLGEMQELTQGLLRAGASIDEINTIRKHLDSAKGGGLARAAAPAHVISLILSDVVGNPLDVIASGPTVADSTSFSDAWRILEHYELLTLTPASVRQRLEQGITGKLPETLKPGAPELERVANHIIGSNQIAAHAALVAASRAGLNTLLLSTYVEGEARDLGILCSAIVRQIIESGEPLPRPACVIIGGETTVTLHGNGRGGRNQEAALAAAIAIDGLKDVTIAFLATDGTDGPTDSAGALVDGQTISRAHSLGLDAQTFLDNNDSYPFFEKLGDHLMTGPTRTNVNDLAFVVVW